MTINGGKPHAVGDRGQRFEVTFFDPSTGERRKFGWATTLDAADAMVRSINAHPSWGDPQIVDRAAAAGISEGNHPANPDCFVERKGPARARKGDDAMSAATIPPITDPLGQHWDQPNRHRIAIDDTHALMDESTFKALCEYSGTMPSGVYDGKMWRRHDGIFDPRCKPEDRRWLLMWYGPSTNGRTDQCSINHRVILLA